MKILNRIYPHALAILGFVLVSLIYFYPVLQGKKIFQSDIAQFTGMAKEQNDFRAAENAEPYWTNSAFGGMPTYQLGANYPNDFIGKLDDALRFLPRPADYLWLYFIGFYILLCSLRINMLKSFFGALAFGLSTYLIVILGVGHNAKAHAIAYMPMVIAGVILVFRQRYVAGGLLTMVAAALEINANHFQMTYYLLILLLVLSVYFIVGLVKEKNFKAIGLALATFAVAGLLAIGSNATNIMATSEYAKWSTRDKSELTFDPDGKPSQTQNAMSNEYITQYSYGISESLDLVFPRLFGGSSEKLGADSKMYEFMVSHGVPAADAKDTALPTYWGDQPQVAAPAYIGAVVFFLAVLCLFMDRRKIKYAFLIGAVVSLMLSWGKNLPTLTNFFIDCVPMYNKFRAVSSIQVLLELCMPVLAIMGLQAFFAPVIDGKPQDRQKELFKALGTCFGIIAVLFLAKGSFSFSGPSDEILMQQYGPVFVDNLKDDRKSLYSADLLRSGFFFAVAGLVLWLYLKNRLKQIPAIVLVGLLMVADLFFIDKNYVDSSDFVSASEVDVPFAQTQADALIQQDTTHYRVFEVEGNMSSARASYFHKSLGGYHAAKPRRMQQIFDYQIVKNNMEIIDMLNIKYIIQTDTTGMPYPTQNPQANGNAWFVKRVQFVESADKEMKALDHIKTKEEAVVNKAEFGNKLPTGNFVKDSLAKISVVTYKPNYLKYVSNNNHEGLAVFSEMYYANGWNAFIDGKKAEHIRADYVLRALLVPAGKHTIEFKFEPEVVKKGSTIALASAIGMLFLFAGGIYVERRKLWFAKEQQS
ncbi:YfhO family protein [Flavobacterium sp.]|uniref:YfhO family protein n=1 Tax=Flavobacterium sp. TaxID=239 RepID=UPI0039E2DEF8